jgi:uncharacterized membrane protein YsdA (DUF1294 family)
MPSFGPIAAAAGIVLWYALAEGAKVQAYLAWLAAWGAVTFAFYGWDKSQSGRGGWRVPEMILHGLSLIGGVGGGWLGMFLFRHKTRHTEFLLVLIVATIIHGVIASSVLR